MKSRQDFETEFEWFEYLRTYAATQAMNGYLSNSNESDVTISHIKDTVGVPKEIKYTIEHYAQYISILSVTAADALIAELNKPKQ